jgi:PknH-like protein
MRIRRTLIPLLIIFFAAACIRVVDGAARPTRGLTPRPLTGQTIKQVLLDDSELSNIIGQRFKGKADLPPRFGGRDLLFPLTASPSECAGVVVELSQSSYENADIGNVAQESWWTAGIRGAKVIDVSESVVALPTAGAADVLFANLIQIWNRCNGTTVTSHFPSGPTAAISDVRAANSVLAATVDAAASTFTITSARAVGVRVNCLVEVNVAFFEDRPGGTAVDVAHQMMDKISRLS